MSRYVDIDQIIADIFDKWGCDPAYYVGVSGADAHEAKLDADLIEFLNQQPSIDIVRCKDCNHWNKKTHICDSSGLHRTESFYCRNGEGERKQANEN